MIDVEALKADVKAKLAMNLHSAGEVVADHIQTMIGTPYPPASSPGDPPHLRTGRLWGSWKVTEDVEEMAVYIWTDTVYAPHLEEGTPRMEPRPFIVRGFEESVNEAMRVLVEGTL